MILTVQPDTFQSFILAFSVFSSINIPLKWWKIWSNQLLKLKHIEYVNWHPPRVNCMVGYKYKKISNEWNITPSFCSNVFLQSFNSFKKQYVKKLMQNITFTNMFTSKTSVRLSVIPCNWFELLKILLWNSSKALKTQPYYIKVVINQCINEYTSSVLHASKPLWNP